MPVLGSGHPQADVLLLKHAPTPAEVEEGVAFYGRTGTALMKSLRRLDIDPLVVYGTLCVKCPVADPTLAAPECVARLIEEIAIVQPKIVVVMGTDALDVLNELQLPLAREVREDPGVIQRLTPSIEALYVPDIDRSLDEESAKRDVLARVPGTGELVERLPSVLSLAELRPDRHGRPACYRPIRRALGVSRVRHQRLHRRAAGRPGDRGPRRDRRRLGPARGALRRADRARRVRARRRGDRRARRHVRVRAARAASRRDGASRRTRPSSSSAASRARPGPPSPFEYWYLAEPAYRAGDYERAYAIAAEGLEHASRQPAAALPARAVTRRSPAAARTRCGTSGSRSRATRRPASGPRTTRPRLDPRRTRPLGRSCRTSRRPGSARRRRARPPARTSR